MMRNSSFAGLQAQERHSGSKHIDAAVSSWVVVSEPRSDVRGVR